MKMILISVGVGALIGLFTNWLAILMLFRPWKELRILGKRMPLTPGLIPRRQQELASKVGEVVEQDLLTPDGLAKSIKRPEVEEMVKQAGIKAIAQTLQETPTAGQLAQKLFGADFQVKVTDKLVDQAIGYLQSEAGRDKLERMAEGLFDHLKGALSSAEVRRKIAHSFAGPLHAQLMNGQLTWQDLLPTGTRQLVEDRLQAQVKPLLAGTSAWIEEPEVIAAIAEMLQEKVKSIPLLGPMAASFLSRERVAADIVPRIQAVIVSSAVQELVTERMLDRVARFWQQPIGSSLSSLSGDDLAALLEHLLEVALQRAESEAAATKEMFKSVLVSGLVESVNRESVAGLVGRIVEQLSAWSVRDFYIERTEQVDALLVKAWRYLRGELIEALPALIEALSIRKVVRDQVSSFPIPRLEALIRSVVNRELRMITLLGGVLGGVIGLVQALLVLI
ncbi:DUF445 family protein [Tumebacillus lipolyticus]|uniref:DUF445 family protein n=1 Tax=Tumebacillus lipolyticus TaxID=1280370 RepID=A0ABW4ZU09_9BACL